MEFEVKPEKLFVIASEERDVQNSLRILDARLEDCKNNLQKCLSSSASPSIIRAIEGVGSKIGNVARKMGVMGERLDEVSELYQKTEGEIAGRKIAEEHVSETVGKLQIKKSDFVLKRTVEPSFLRLFGLDGNPGENDLDMADWISKVINKLNERSVLGLMGVSLAYGSDLWNLLYKTWKGDVGAGVAFDLAEDGGKLWGGMYKLLDKNLMKRLGMKNGSVLGKEFGNTVGYVGLAASFAGFLNQYVDTLGGKYQSWQEQVGAWLDTGGKGVGVVKNAHYVQNMTEGIVSKGAKSKGGWFTLGETVLNTCGQAFSSYGKYNADGKITVAEAAQIGTEFSTKGLTTLISGVTFGIVDIDADYASQTMGNWAKDQGTAIGETIRRNPEMRDKFNNGNFADKMYAFGWGTIHHIFG